LREEFVEGSVNFCGMFAVSALVGRDPVGSVAGEGLLGNPARDSGIVGSRSPLLPLQPLLNLSSSQTPALPPSTDSRGNASVRPAYFRLENLIVREATIPVRSFVGCMKPATPIGGIQGWRSS